MSYNTSIYQLILKWSTKWILYDSLALSFPPSIVNYYYYIIITSFLQFVKINSSRYANRKEYFNRIKDLSRYFEAKEIHA